MGRGRQKAKHTKIARELKYSVPSTDYDALERELSGRATDDDETLQEDLEKWPEYAGQYGSDDFEDDDAEDSDESKQ